MSEGVVISISADAQASKVLGKVAENVDDKVKPRTSGMTPNTKLWIACTITIIGFVLWSLEAGLMAALILYALLWG